MMLQFQANAASHFMPNNNASHFMPDNNASHFMPNLLQQPFISTQPFIPTQSHFYPPLNNYPLAHSGTFGPLAPAQQQQPVAAVAGLLGPQPPWVAAGVEAQSSCYYHPLGDNSGDCTDVDGRHARDLRFSFAATQDEAIPDRFSAMADTLLSEHGAVPSRPKKRASKGAPRGGGARAKKARSAEGSGGGATDGGANDGGVLEEAEEVKRMAEERQKKKERQKKNRLSAKKSHEKNTRLTNEREESIVKLTKLVSERDDSIDKLTGQVSERDQIIKDIEARNAKFRAVMVEACRTGKSASDVFSDLDAILLRVPGHPEAGDAGWAAA